MCIKQWIFVFRASLIIEVRVYFVANNQLIALDETGIFSTIWIPQLSTSMYPCCYFWLPNWSMQAFSLNFIVIDSGESILQLCTTYCVSIPLTASIVLQLCRQQHTLPRNCVCNDMHCLAAVYTITHIALQLHIQRHALPCNCENNNIHCFATVCTTTYIALQLHIQQHTLPCNCVHNSIHCLTGALRHTAPVLHVDLNNWDAQWFEIYRNPDAK